MVESKNELNDNLLEDYVEYIHQYYRLKQKINVTFVYQMNNELYCKTYERGSGLTFSCGSGAVAAYKMMHDNNKIKERVKVNFRGGDYVLVNQEDGVHIIGEAKYICKGEYEYE